MSKTTEFIYCKLEDTPKFFDIDKLKANDPDQKELYKKAKKILLNNGFINTFKTAHTRDIYFGKNDDFNFTVDNTDIATIENGVVTAQGIGTVTVTATSKYNPLVKSNLSIRVGDPTSEFMIRPSVELAKIKVGEILPFTSKSCNAKALFSLGSVSKYASICSRPIFVFWLMFSLR